MIRGRVTINMDAASIRGRADQAKEKAQFVLDEQALKDSNYFIPKDTGNLEASSLNASQVGSGEIVWNTPYANKLYYNPEYDFSKDSNPNAQGVWFEAAKALYGDDWVNVAKQAYEDEFGR